MRRWAFIHPASGAIVALTSREAAMPPADLLRIEVQDGISPAAHWWDGQDFADRQLGYVTALPHVAVGDMVELDCPPDAWLSLPDGTFASGGSFEIPQGYKQIRFTLVGRYFGEAVLEVISSVDPMAAVREERDRRLTSTDKYVLADFPITGALRAAWLGYRQALRELPEAQPNASLATADWPVAPIAA